MTPTQETLATWIVGIIFAAMVAAVLKLTWEALCNWFAVSPPERPRINSTIPPTVHIDEPSEQFKRCRGCGERPRTHPKPELGRIWFDRIPLVSWVGRLYGAPAKLTVRVPMLGVEHYCRECQADAVADLELMIANNINALAKVTNEQTRASAHVNATLDQRIRKRHSDRQAEIAEEFGASEPPRKQLQSGSEADTHSLPAMTSGQREGAG